MLNGLLVDFRISDARSRQERDVALAILQEVESASHAILACDKGYDIEEFVKKVREAGYTPHVAQKKKYSAIDARTTRHAGYAVSQKVRKRIEEIFGWMKTVGDFRRTRYKGRARTQLAGYLVGAAYNLVRIAKLMAIPA